MEDYLIDRETLGQFIDELMKKRTLPVNSAEELTKFREEQIRILDNRISTALFGILSEEQVTNLNRLLDQQPDDPDAFFAFFASQNLDIQQIITNAITTFGTEFLAGGENA